MIKLLITEDHPMLAQGLVKSFESVKQIDVVGVAKNGTECINLYKHLVPDIVLLDFKLPDMNGAEIAEELLKLNPKCQIIVLTTHSQQYYVKQMLDIGIKSYLLKSCDFDEIVNAIYIVAKGQTYFCKEIELQIQANSETSINISKREVEVLQLIAQGLTNQQIADRLFISPLTVDSHRKNLIIKLNAKNTASLISEAMAKGYL